ncbi:MAG: hypothetical protein AAB884_01800, partial [Patescibacteria group bacterium]
MHFDSKGKFVRTDMWREGKWLDLWSVVHFLSGITMGFLPKFFGLDAFPAYAIAFLLLVLYEMFEALAKIEETRTNRFMDVVVGMVSFIPVYHLNFLLPTSESVILGVIFLFASSALSFTGWRASKKAAVFEAKLREGIALGKEKIQTR